VTGAEQPAEPAPPAPAPPAPAPPAPPAPAAQESIAARIRHFIEVIGPTTLVTALLIYFGYVATRARFDYFGVSLEMTGLSNQSLLLYGLEVVYVPAALVILATLTAIGVHGAIRWQLARRPGDIANAVLAAGIVLVGVLLIGRALIGIFIESSETSVDIGITPIALAFGPATVAYGVWVYGKNRGRPLMPHGLAGKGAICAIGLAVAGLYWSSTQFAWAYGTGRGEQDARELNKRPEVIVDTKEPLVGLPVGVTQTPLGPAGKGRTFAYRYRGFLLLLSSGGRLFLVTANWTIGRDQTIVLPYDNDIRIQLVPSTETGP
jgi:hypothetical protein